MEECRRGEKNNEIVTLSLQKQREGRGGKGIGTRGRGKIKHGGAKHEKKVVSKNEERKMK